MKIKLIFILLIFNIYAYGQNRLQPDSIYSNRKVKKIIAFLNSPKDLSEEIFFSPDGRIIRKISYSASYNLRTRKNKSIELKSHYIYNSQKKLIQIVDSVIYSSNSSEINNTYFYYDSIGRLKASKYFQRSFKIPMFETYYNYSPFKTIHLQRYDTTIVRYDITEYEFEFYECKSYGYSLDAKIKDGYFTNGRDSSRFQYADHKDLQKSEQREILKNKYNSIGQLTNSEVMQTFLNDRKFECNLIYTYYSNGLLKSIRGYIPEYFKYEFYK